MIRTTALHTVLATASVAGCAHPSSQVETDEITATMSVTTDGSRETRIHAALRVNLVQDVVLSEGDRLYAGSAGDRVEMATVDRGDYEAYLLDVVPLSVVTIDLERDDAISATSEVVLPAAFEIQALPEPSYDRDTWITLRWTPAVPGGMSIVIEGPCVNGRFATVPDFGSYEFPGLAGVEIPGEACEVTATLTRTMGGIPDPAFDGFSGMRADQVRTITFISTP